MTPSKKKEGNTHDRILKRCLNSNRLKKGRKYKIETRKKERKKERDKHYKKLLKIHMYIPTNRLSYVTEERINSIARLRFKLNYTMNILDICNIRLSSVICSNKHVSNLCLNVSIGLSTGPNMPQIKFSLTSCSIIYGTMKEKERNIHGQIMKNG